MRTHIGCIETGFTEDEYQAFCTCGWEGAQRSKMEEAEADIKTHYAETE